MQCLKRLIFIKIDPFKHAFHIQIFESSLLFFAAHGPLGYCAIAYTNGSACYWRWYRRHRGCHSISKVESPYIAHRTIALAGGDDFRSGCFLYRWQSSIAIRHLAGISAAAVPTLWHYIFSHRLGKSYQFRTAC